MNTSIFFLLLASVSIFSYSTEMTDAHILPKWLYTLGASAVLGIIISLRGMRGLKNSNRPKIIFIFIIVLCISQSIYGIVQAFGLLPGSSTFQIVGSFDNPAGLAACLCTGVPCCLFFLQKDNKKSIKWFANGSLLLIGITLFLSGSRAGLIASITVFGWWLLSFIKSRLLWCFVVILGIGLSVGMYFMKKDSANGRLLMMLCGWEMIKERPISGYGINGITAHYMDYQAKWLAAHPNSSLKVLADNVKHVFNEYLAIGIRYGLIGILAFIGIILFLLHSYRKSPSKEGKCALMSLVCMGILACFSYPFTYPFIWLVLIIDIYIILRQAYPFPKLHNAKIRYTLSILILITSCTLLTKILLRIDAELKWGKAVHIPLSEKQKENFSNYQVLIPILGNNPYFLYNYAVELFLAKQYEEALNQAKYCRKYWADYHLEILQGDILHHLKRDNEAEGHYRLASQMCPIRFIPLYKLYSIYKENRQTEKAKELGEIILQKPIKVNSITIQTIKKQIKTDLGKYEN